MRGFPRHRPTDVAPQRHILRARDPTCAGSSQRAPTQLTCVALVLASMRHIRRSQMSPIKRRVAGAIAVAAIGTAVVFYAYTVDRADRQAAASLNAKPFLVLGSAAKTSARPATYPNSSSTATLGPGKRADAPVSTSALAGRAPLHEQYEKSADLKAFVDSIGRDTVNPEQKAYVARALRSCADVAASSVEAQAQRYESKIPATSPNRSARISAHRRNLERCRGFEGMPISRAEAERLMEEAAAAGSAFALSERLVTLERQEGTEHAASMLVRVLESLDPVAMLNALDFVRTGRAIKLGAEPDATVNAPLAQAWMLVTCDFGLDCGPESPVVRAHCVSLNQCDANSFEEIVLAGIQSGEDASYVQRIRANLRQAISERNWRALGITLPRR